MRNETFQPISVKPPASNPLLFSIRCFIDLQLGTIVGYLRPAMLKLSGRVLDVGAGESPWREWLPSNCIYQGVDSVDSTDFGMKSGKNDVVYYDGKTMPFDESSFDSAICIEVLEHVDNPDLFLSEISRVLKGGSVLLLSVPWSARRHHIPNDFHRFTREQLSRLFLRNGFECIDIKERGNDIAVIANKLIVLNLRLLKPFKFFDLCWTIPIFAILVIPTFVMMISAHISISLDRGSKEDPLGYFVSAVCSKSESK